jgi:hypothetical protein
MNDRELLELAAKASGISWFGGGINGLATGKNGACLVGWWNPLTDDGDALRLAVKLELDLLIYADGAEVLSKTTSPILEDAYKDHGMDACAATRRAIVRAAAAIADAMNNEGN